MSGGYIAPRGIAHVLKDNDDDFDNTMESYFFTNMELHMVAGMEVDKVADKVADMVAGMTADKKRSVEATMR